MSDCVPPLAVGKQSPDASPRAPLAARADFLPRPLRLAMLGAAGVMIVGSLVALRLRIESMPSHFGPLKWVGPTSMLFVAQDATWLLIGGVLLAVLTGLRLTPSLRGCNGTLARSSKVAALCLATLIFAVTSAGTFLVFQNFHLTRDEILADFDAIIFRSGHLIAPLVDEWRPFAKALNPDFMLPVPDDTGWASGYLPVNAGLRALFGLISEPALTNPVLATLSMLTLIAIARRLWPDRKDAAFVSALLLATSSQFLFTAMTSYAMTAHLAFNLVWLWLYLRDDRSSHAAAIGVGLFATGLHQLVFHPLFVAPFILRLWRMRRRSLALVYLLAYALICLFWASYGQIALRIHGATPAAAQEAGPAYFLMRVEVLVLDFDVTGAALMLQNVLRFIGWQNLLALPLVLAAFGAQRNRDGVARPLAEGLLATLVAMFVVLPYQGYGWGYRYLHGLLGSFSLLAGYGWIAVTSLSSDAANRAVRMALLVASAVTIMLMLPARAIQARSSIAPYRQAVAAIESAPAEIVIVDPFGVLLVRNDPFLRNRPKVLDLALLDESQIGDLCRRFKVALFDEQQGARLGIPTRVALSPADEQKRTELRAYLTRLSCGTEVVLGTARAPAP